MNNVFGILFCNFCRCPFTNATAHAWHEQENERSAEGIVCLVGKRGPGSVYHQRYVLYDVIIIFGMPLFILEKAKVKSINFYLHSG